jgi:hypothetical protein
MQVGRKTAMVALLDEVLSTEEERDSTRVPKVPFTDTQ